MNILNNLVIRLMLLLTCLSLFSCKSNILIEPQEFDGTSYMEFNSTLQQNISQFMSVDVVSGCNVNDSAKTRSQAKKIIQSNNNKNTPVAVDMGKIPVTENVDISSIKSYGDMYELSNKLDAEFYVLDREPVAMEAVIFISEEDAMQALSPLIQQSKLYLYRKGFTEVEIQEMLNENNCSSSALVPLVLLLAEDESNYASDYQNIINNCEDFTRTNVDMNKIVDCAKNVVGIGLVADFVSEWGNSTGKLTKAAIKIIFKKIAPKIIGPVGIGLMVIEFSGCYFNMW